MAQNKRTGPVHTLQTRYPGVRGYRAVEKMVATLGLEETERRMAKWHEARHEDDPESPPPLRLGRPPFRRT